MRKFLISTLLILTFILSSCGFVEVASSPESNLSSAPAQIAFRLMTVDPHATITPTPFQPLPRTPTYVPTVATATPTPTETPVPPTATPTEVPIPVPKGQITIALLGSDSRGTADFRTDVIVIAALNPGTGTITLLSFPRDLYVFIPGWYNERINVAMEFGGFKTFQATMQQNFGFTPNHYVMTNFNSFKKAIDSLDGISVNVSKQLTDRCDIRIQRAGWCTLGPGQVSMDGETALWYVRSRHSSSDFDRTRRAQEVLQAMFFRLLKLDSLTRLPQLYNDFRGSVETDLSLGDIVQLLPYAAKIAEPDKIRHFAIGPGEVYDWIAPGGAMVLVPIQPNAQNVVRQALNP